MIPSEFITDLLDKLDIVELIGQYLSLKKKGANFTGLCPFHNEKTASFTVSPAKQFYHCFGCGAHGSVITFMMQYLGQSFQDVVKDLSQRCGLTLPSTIKKILPSSQEYKKKEALIFRVPLLNQKEKNDSRDQDFAQEILSDNRALLDLISIAMNFYRRELRGSLDAIAYLKKRGISGEVAARFKLGYAASGWRNLLSVFENYESQNLIDAGLVVGINNQERLAKDRDGEIIYLEREVGANSIPRRNVRYDRFRKRIIFPINNLRGQIIGFGGRTIVADEDPKYLNSPETPLFKKGRELYGLFEGRKYIREKKYVLVVEGYLDVLMLVQAGFENTVATLGTACTSDHIRKLIRQADRIIFCFDGDVAGRKGAYRALLSALPFASDTREFGFMLLPDGHDPDSFVRSKGVKSFEQEITNAMPLSSFLIHEALADKNLDKPEGRAAALFCAKPLLRSLPPQSLQLHIINMLAERLNLESEEVANLCELDNQKVLRKKKISGFLARQPVKGIEYRALCILLMFPHFVTHLNKESMETLLFCTERPELFQEVFSYVAALNGEVLFRDLLEHLRKSTYSGTFEDLFLDILKTPENTRDLYAPEKGFPQSEVRSQLEKSSQIEFYSALARLRYDACCKKLKELSSVSNLSKDQLLEVSNLSKLSLELRKGLSLHRCN